jgi:hypothetical protein
MVRKSVKNYMSHELSVRRPLVDLPSLWRALSAFP